MAAQPRQVPDGGQDFGGGGQDFCGGRRTKVSELNFELLVNIFLEKNAEHERRIEALEARILKLESRGYLDSPTNDVPVNDVSSTDDVDGLVPEITKLYLDVAKGDN